MSSYPMKVDEIYEDKNGYYFKIRQIFPKNSLLNKEHKTTAKLVDVWYSSNNDFSFALGKVFKISDLKKSIKRKLTAPSAEKED